MLPLSFSILFAFLAILLCFFQAFSIFQLKKIKTELAQLEEDHDNLMRAMNNINTINLAIVDTFKGLGVQIASQTRVKDEN